MPRKPTPITSDLPYHLTARSNNREWFYLPIPDVWQIFANTLAIVCERYELQVIAFVLMTNHYHLLAQFPQANMGEAMNYLQREISRAIGKNSNRINHVFGGPYKASLIAHTPYLKHVYRYIYRNPVEANLSHSVQDYAFSTFQNLYEDSAPPFSLRDDLALNWAPIPVNLEERAEWLNFKETPETLELIRRALRRTTFRFPSGNCLYRGRRSLNT